MSLRCRLLPARLGGGHRWDNGPAEFTIGPGFIADIVEELITELGTRTCQRCGAVDQSWLDDAREP